MAVISNVPGIRVTVRVNGEPLTEYDDPEGESNECGTVTKYIEATDGAEFTVVTEVLDDYNWDYKNHELGNRIYVDGKLMRAKQLRQSMSTKMLEVSGTKEKLPNTGQWMFRRFKFAPINTVLVESSSQSGTSQCAIHDLGTIMVKVRRQKRCHVTYSDQVYSGNTELQIPEKALKGKAISHSTMLTEGEAVRAPRPSSSIAIDAKPIAIFHFNYRSRSALMDEMIIKRESTPDPLDALPVEELRRLARERLDMKVSSFLRAGAPSL
ncbi:hypothetical protein Micbo1qcDRAFT_170261 [Microdochium bolleyi]|uniref:DUF7918 domain-containing protein n=1 Tax=Microdochium bolleyi TaxID=196109 RepID=A0A136JH04_9PEZI|nr:hypothetical protein Micbo1qcDRAFT_170261 [Microdochium bolleyi]